jgi:predicted alpha/beta superfamily hydrolase
MGMIPEQRGEIVFERPISSTILKGNRMIRVYLPGTYKQYASKHYPVLYAHDGQNIFSTAGPHTAFGWGSWELDHTADRLASSGTMREIIIVAIDCSPSRYREYRGPIGPGADNRGYQRYRDFLIQELKPQIDRQYRTLGDAAHTALLGSSMGGICSVALAWQNPEVFGLAASMSGAFQVENKYFLKQILEQHHSGAKPVRIYLDSGTCDYTGGDDGCKETSAVAAELKRIGWSAENLTHYIDHPLTREELEPFHLSEEKRKEAQRSQHNELYWRLRVNRPLTWLFPPETEG